MPLPTTDPALPLDDTRARFRAYGLVESYRGTTHIYSVSGAGTTRMLLALQSVGRGAQIYLFPEALNRMPGAAQPFYTTLEAAGFGMGSKLGPSINLALEDEARTHIFWLAFDRLMHAEAGFATAVRP